MRVHELAKALKISSKELMPKLKQLRIQVKSSMSVLDADAGGTAEEMDAKRRFEQGGFSSLVGGVDADADALRPRLLYDDGFRFPCCVRPALRVNKCRGWRIPGDRPPSVVDADGQFAREEAPIFPNGELQGSGGDGDTCPTPL